MLFLGLLLRSCFLLGLLARNGRLLPAALARVLSARHDRAVRGSPFSPNVCGCWGDETSRPRGELIGQLGGMRLG